MIPAWTRRSASGAARAEFRSLDPSRDRRPSNLWFDRILVAGLLMFNLVVALSDPSGPALAVVGTLQIVPLLWRRSRPVLVFVLVALATVAQIPFTDLPMVSQLAFAVAIYSAARWGGPEGRWTSAVVSLCGAFVASVLWTWDGARFPWDYLPNLITVLAVSGLSWAFGFAGHARNRAVEAILARSDDARLMAERDAALAAQDERARIAREMHDVVAHGLSVIVVQADGARYAAAQNPAIAVETLETIAATGRESLQEMRRLLGLLRTDDSGLRPQPVLADVVHLVEEARALGTEVEAHLPADFPTVSDGAGLAAYRFVQEALTNVRKHAGPGAKVEVRVEARPHSGVLLLEVNDDGRGAATVSGASKKGLGLLGMRERVQVHGGLVEAGPRVGGGWSVSARIPL